MYLLPSLLKEALHHFTIRTKLGVSKSHIYYCNNPALSLFTFSGLSTCPWSSGLSAASSPCSGLTVTRSWVAWSKNQGLTMPTSMSPWDLWRLLSGYGLNVSLSGLVPGPSSPWPSLCTSSSPCFLTALLQNLPQDCWLQVSFLSRIF